MNKIVFEQEIYTYQIDYVGHLSNIVYIEWMEIGRTKLLEYIGLTFEKMETENIAPVLSETEIKYKKSLYLADKIKIEVWVSELKNASAVISFNFFNGKNELAAIGNQLGLFINLTTKKPHRLTEDQRRSFQKVLIPNN
ncbi:MAG: acyl-CoA thioesterase [Ignavibacteriales bacterium]|nr:acyl-CoA thioesterase [Ignavibacteriales bacterium]MBK7981357.1 acyl-CoA thioesterase [Ignavibacteriota bacterium]